MTYRNRSGLLALTCAGALALTGCTPNPEAGRPAPAPPTTTTTAPSTSSPSVTPSASPSGPPLRPAAAKGLTLAAAEAFIGYYVVLLNYSYTTGNPQPLLSASERGCVGCRGVSDYARKVNGANGGLQGDYKDTLVNVKEVFRGSSGRIGGSAVIRSGSYYERANPKASLVPQAARPGTMEFTLSAARGAWVMYEMELKE